MYIPLGFKTDYSLLKSLIKIDDLISFLKVHNIDSCGILDNNLFGSIEFYLSCIKNNLKPIIGLEFKFENKSIYLYAKDYDGYRNLLKINSKIFNNVNLEDLTKYSDQVILVIPYQSYELYDELKEIYVDVYVSYVSEEEKNNALLITKNIVFLNNIKCFDKKNIKYLDYLKMIDEGKTIDDCMKDDNTYNYFISSNLLTNDDIESTIKFGKLINIEIPLDKTYIPTFDESRNSEALFKALCSKGLSKRLNGKIPTKYVERLKYEISVIKDMGYIDYFLIVYDYVLYAKTNDILVGPGRGSAAGSLVSYCLGITEIDPIKYDLMFERFLNPERITMPDIDIDFEYTKREKIVDYVKDKYGGDFVAPIMTYGTLASRQVLRDVAKVMNVDSNLIDTLIKKIKFSSQVTLKENYQQKEVKELVSKNETLFKTYEIAYHLEGLKRHVSTHAAGVVISSKTLDNIIPMYKNNDLVLTGVTMNYLEDLGLLKMDFLALKNLTIIKNVIEGLEKVKKQKIDINKIDLNDRKTLELFYNVKTIGIFQYESTGMMNFLSKLKVKSFDDLIAAVALFRPGPMENIPSFIARKEGREKITYPLPELEKILRSTYGIIVYQEQILEILRELAGYSYAEADNIRRAMSKKNKEIMEKEREVFVARCLNRGIKENISNEIYDLIIKFSNYGFPKAHAVSYALVGYQMGYLKSNYPNYFIGNLLNMSIGSEIKTKEYIDEAKLKNIEIIKPSINSSNLEYTIGPSSLLLPLSIIKNLGQAAVKTIINERIKNGKYIDFFDFVSRTYGKSVNKKTIESLIDADVFSEFNFNKKTLHENIDNAVSYAELMVDLDPDSIIKPVMEKKEEYELNYLMEKELDIYGFYITNHPASKYISKDIVKLNNITNYFDRYIKTVVIIKRINKIKTKKNDDMAFLEAEDETSSLDYVIFPKEYNLVTNLKVGDLIEINGQVTKRFDKYQIVIKGITKL